MVYYYRMTGHAVPLCSMCSSMSTTCSMLSPLPTLASSFSRSFSAAQLRQQAGGGTERENSSVREGEGVRGGAPGWNAGARSSSFQCEAVWPCCRVHAVKGRRQSDSWGGGEGGGAAECWKGGMYR